MPDKEQGMQMIASRPLFTILLVLGVLALPTAGPAANAPIQPGAPMSSSVGGCTMNFVFRNTHGKLFVGSAGHCVEALGDRVTASSIGPFGTVVFRANNGVGKDDFSLIRIDTDKYEHVEPTVRAWGGPTGTTTSESTASGDQISLQGYGLVFGSNARTQARPGILVSDTATQYRAEIPAIFGDSGGPVLHAATGRALGIVSGINAGVGPYTLVGTTVERALALIGPAYSLVTAPYPPTVP